MARPLKQNNTKDVTCLNCCNMFTIPKSKNRQFCSVSCSQKYTKSKNKNWLDKRENTNMLKYGVKSPLESEDIKTKYRSNLIDKYGVDNPFLVKEFKDKAKQTIKSKYGVNVASQNKKVSKQIS